VKRIAAVGACVGEDLLRDQLGQRREDRDRRRGMLASFASSCKPMAADVP